MDVRKKLFTLFQDCNNPSWKWFPNNAEMLKLIDYLIANGVTVQELDGCGFCQKFDFAGARAEVNKYGAHISLAICNTKFPNEERFKFCPMCGRRLPQPPKGE